MRYIRPLLNRRPLLENESLPSYLHWLRVNNHYTTKTALRRICELHLPELTDTLMQPVCPDIYDVLGKIALIDPLQLYQATSHPFTSVLTPPHETPLYMAGSKLVGSSISDWSAAKPLLARGYATKFLWTDKDVQFCPVCIKESLHHRVDWMPYPVAVCLDHTCLLQRRCPACLLPVSIEGLYNGSCRYCEFEWEHTPVTKLDEDEWGLFSQELIQDWFGLVDVPEKVRFTTEPFASLNSLPNMGIPEVSTSTLFYLLFGISRGIAGMPGSSWVHNVSVQRRFPLNSSKATLFPAQVYVLFATALRGMVNWPHGFYEFLDVLCAYGEEEDDTSIAHIQKAFRNIYVYWLERGWRHEAFQCVQDAFDEYLLQRYLISPSFLRLRRVRDNPAFMKLLPFITEAEASRKLGCVPTTVKKLVENGILVTYQQANPDQPQPEFNLIRQTEVVALRHRWRSAISLLDAAARLGISSEAALKLVEADFLEAVRGPAVDGSPEWRLDKASVTYLQKSLEQRLLLRFPPGAEALTFTKAVQTLSVHGFNVVLMVQAILKGQLRAYSGCGRLQEMLFCREDVEKLREVLYQERQLLSRKQVAKMLAVKPHIVQTWVDAGLLQTTDGGSSPNSLKFLPQQVEQFKEDYIFSDEASQMLGIGELAVQKWARHGRLHPVCGGEGSDLHRYLFCRDEIMKFAPENRLTAPELAKELGLSRTHMTVWIKEGKVKPVSGPGIDDMKHFLFLRSQLEQKEGFRGSIS